MGKTVLITGGARSGKSGFAEKMAGELGEKVLYIATSVPFDDEMKERVKKHKAARPSEWDTYEGYKDISGVIRVKGHEYNIVLIDCVTVMITNLLFEQVGIDASGLSLESFEAAENYINCQIDELLKAINASNINVIMVTNEIGSGIVPENLLSRVFRDIAGRVNQMIASGADEVYLTVCGIPMKVK